MLLAFCLIVAAAAGPKPISIGAALPLSGPEMIFPRIAAVKDGVAPNTRCGKLR
jgi:hypothetical protein